MSIFDRSKPVHEPTDAERAASDAYYRAEAQLSRVAEAVSANLKRELDAEGEGWLSLTGGGGAGAMDISASDLEDIRSTCIVLWENDPTLGQAAMLLQSGALGGGIGTPTATDSRVEKVVTRFWEDPDNQLSVFGREAQILLNLALIVEGEKWYSLHTSDADDQVKVADLAVGEITQVITHPENRRKPVMYRREFRPQVLNVGSGQYTPATETVVWYYRDWRYAPWLMEAEEREDDAAEVLFAEAGTNLQEDAALYQVKTNTLGLRGVPEAHRMSDWSKAHARSVRSLVALTKALAMFAWQRQVTTKSAATLKAMADQMKTPPPGDAAVLAENQNVKTTPVNVGTGGSTNLTGASRETLLEAIRPFGFGEHFYGDSSCYTADTEVLTEDGWRNYKDVEDGTRIACYHPGQHQIQWQEPIELHEFEVDEEIVHITTRAQDIAVTKDHRMLARPNSQSKRLPPEGARPEGKAGRPRIADGGAEILDRGYNVTPANTLDSRSAGWSFRTAPDSAVQGSTIFTDDPEGAALFEGVSPEDVGTFLGWFVSEGSTLGPLKKNGDPRTVLRKRTSKREKRIFYRISIAQKPGADADDIRALLERLPWAVHELDCNGVINFNFQNKRLWTWLREQCGTGSYTKRLPDGSALWPISVLERLWDAAVKGDGTRNGKNGNNICYKSMSKELVDGLQVAALLLGWQANIAKHADGIWAINGSTRREAGVVPRNISREVYQGTVWCYQVPTGFFVTRRNGKVAIQGNSGNLATATAMELPAIWRIDDRQAMYRGTWNDLCQFAIGRVRAETRAPFVSLPLKVDTAIDINMPPAQPRTPESTATLLTALPAAVAAGIVEQQEASYQAYVALGTNNIAEVMEEQYPPQTKMEGKAAEDEGGVDVPEADAAIPPAPDEEEATEESAQEARRQEAVRPFELRRELDALEVKFARALQRRVISPWHKDIKRWLETLDYAPSERALTRTLRREVPPDAVALRETLDEFTLKAGNIGGQGAVNAILAALSAPFTARRTEAVANREGETLRERLARGEEWNAAAGEAFVFNLRDPKLLNELQARGVKITGEVSQTMLENLRDTLSREFYTEGQGPREVAKRIDKIFPRTYAGRAENIARTETLVAQGTVGHEAYVQNGVEKKQWLTLLDSETRADHAAAHGQVRRIDDAFDVGGEAMQHPGDPGASAGNVCNCRCDELPVIDDETDLPAQPWLGGYQPLTEAARTSAAPIRGAIAPPAPAAAPSASPSFATPEDGEKWFAERGVAVKYDEAGFEQYGWEVSAQDKANRLEEVAHAMGRLEANGQTVVIDEVEMWSRHGGRLSANIVDDEGRILTHTMQIGPREVGKPGLEDMIYVLGEKAEELEAVNAAGDVVSLFASDGSIDLAIAKQKFVAGTSCRSSADIALHEAAHGIEWQMPTGIPVSSVSSQWQRFAKEQMNLFSAYASSSWDEALSEAFVELQRGTYRSKMLSPHLRTVFEQTMGLK